MHFGAGCTESGFWVSCFFFLGMLPPLAIWPYGIHLTTMNVELKEGKYNNVLVIYVTQQPRNYRNLLLPLL